MLTISLKFISGQYHATPWGRNVNEGLIEYPPAPYRILRAIIDAWKRKGKLLGIDDANIKHVLEEISEAPEFYLPQVSTGFTLSYLSANEKDIDKKAKIYDTFVSIEPDKSIYIKWKNASINEEEKKDFDTLLNSINYLGRSESWVKFAIYDGDTDLNNLFYIYPVEDNETINGIINTTKVAVPVDFKQYKDKKIEWLDAIELTTTDLKTVARPYAMEFKDYYLPEDIIKVDHIKKNKSNRTINGVLYQLNSAVLPLITETMEISERFHRKLLGTYKKIFEEDPPPIFTGRNKDGSILKGHKHIYIMPVDINNDGRLDHILIKCSQNFNDKQLYCLDIINSLWQSNGKPDLFLFPVEWTDTISKNFEKNTNFISTTPFIPTRHYRKGRGDFKEWLKKQIILELNYINLPDPESIELIKYNNLSGHIFYWLDFTRSRKNDKPEIGYGFKLKFKDEIDMPFSLGYASHFGLGQFIGDKHG